jgi:CubicO group peptidase (beta-lactamase class C family)
MARKGEMSARSILLPVLALLAGCGSGSGSDSTLPPPPPPPPPSALIDMDQTLDDFVANNANVPSVAMLAVKDGVIVYSHTAGFVDAARTRAPTESSLYKTSSIAKLVIAVAVMQQVELGLLDLDQDVGNYLPFAVRNPAFPDQVITPRMLMHHAGGLALPDFGTVTDRLFEVSDPGVIVQLHPLIEDVLTRGSTDYRDAIWLDGAPGSVNRNSNVGMVLLAYLVERLSGLHFIDYAKIHIFLPLGMVGTSHYFPDLDLNEVVALYDSNDNLVSQTSNWFYPISGLFTSTGDWANFLRAILAGGTYNGIRILQPSSVDAMLKMTTPANNQLAYDSNIGLIWREAEANPGWYGHTGAGTQMTHITELDPVNGIGYVLFTNEGLIDNLVGPGSELNRTIHEWLDQLQRSGQS